MLIGKGDRLLHITRFQDIESLRCQEFMHFESRGGKKNDILNSDFFYLLDQSSEIITAIGPPKENRPNLSSKRFECLERRFWSRRNRIIIKANPFPLPYSLQSMRHRFKSKHALMNHLHRHLQINPNRNRQADILEVVISQKLPLFSWEKLLHIMREIAVIS